MDLYTQNKHKYFKVTVSVIYNVRGIKGAAVTCCQGRGNEMVSKTADPKLPALSRPAKSLAAN